MEIVDICCDLTFTSVEPNVGPSFELAYQIEEPDLVLSIINNKSVVVGIPLTSKLDAARGNVVVFTGGFYPADKRFVDHQIE